MKQDYNHGRQLHDSGKPFEDCTTEAQRDGWQDAAADANDAGLQAECACMAEAQEDGEYINWPSYWNEMDRMTGASHA